jgi:hypothetical protein
VAARNMPEAYYNFTDPDLIYSGTYYRLKMIDNNGMFKYSSTLLLSPELKLGLKSVKNPFKNIIHTEIITPGNGTISLQVFNDKGQVVKKIQQEVRTGLNTIIIDNIPGTNGIYFLAISYGHEMVKTKLIRLN